jgi:hypothetical protein
VAEPAHQGAGFRLGDLFPSHIQGPQNPEPPQQVVRVAPAGLGAGVAEHPVPQVPADRLNLPVGGIRHEPWQRRRTARHYRPHPGQPYSPVNQITMKRRSLVHPRMLTNHGPRVERITPVVQLTDQALHRAFGVGAAVFTAWLAIRREQRR